MSALGRLRSISRLNADGSDGRKLDPGRSQRRARSRDSPSAQCRRRCGKIAHMPGTRAGRSTSPIAAAKKKLSLNILDIVLFVIGIFLKNIFLAVNVTI